MNVSVRAVRLMNHVSRRALDSLLSQYCSRNFESLRAMKIKLLTLQVRSSPSFGPLPIILVLAISTESCVIVETWASFGRLNVYYLTLAHKLFPKSVSSETGCERQSRQT